MFNKKQLKLKIATSGVIAFGFLSGMVISYGSSWLITCALVKLITLCFGLNFNWGIASGIWVILICIKSVLGIRGGGIHNNYVKHNRKH